METDLIIKIAIIGAIILILPLIIAIIVGNIAKKMRIKQRELLRANPDGIEKAKIENAKMNDTQIESTAPNPALTPNHKLEQNPTVPVFDTPKRSSDIVKGDAIDYLKKRVVSHVSPNMDSRPNAPTTPKTPNNPNTVNNPNLPNFVKNNTANNPNIPNAVRKPTIPNMPRKPDTK